MHEIESFCTPEPDVPVPIRALVVVRRDGTVSAVFLKTDHPSAQFYQRSYEKSLLADGANALLSLLTRADGTAGNSAAYRVYRDVFGGKEPLTAKKRLYALRKAELIRKKAFGAEEVPQIILDLVPGIDLGDSGVAKKGQYAGYKTKTALRVITKRLWHEYEAVASKIFGFATHSEHIKKQWQCKSDAARKEIKQACREGGYFWARTKKEKLKKGR